MRITNKMMTNNMLHHINTNKNNMSTLEGKYSSGMEIQKPSDDPIVAVRALKLRTNLSELNQYYNKNIPDAMSWMEVTESALKNTSEIITKIHTYCNQGANDTLTAAERDSIAQNLSALKDQIYQEGNSNYAGRYLFTGYKTSTSLVFENDTSNLDYIIHEDIDGSEIDISDRIVNTCRFDSADPDAFDINAKPASETVYRIRLSYDNIKGDADKKGDGELVIKFPKFKENGEYDLDANENRQYDDSKEIKKSNMTPKKSSDSDAYRPGDNEIYYLEDTGEIILGKNKYQELRHEKFEVTYRKDSFKKNDLRPEHYFNCESLDTDDSKAKRITYTKEDQDITYEVNFNQRLAINVQAKDAFRPSLGRSINDIVNAVSDYQTVETDIANVEKMIEAAKAQNDASQQTKLEKIKKVLESELALKDTKMREAYGKGLTAMDNEENAVNAATSDIGTRYNRLELTQDRLSSQQVEFTELLSQNEDADLVDTIVNYNAANTIYNASLQAAGKVVKNTLLDFI